MILRNIGVTPPVMGLAAENLRAEAEMEGRRTKSRAEERGGCLFAGLGPSCYTRCT